MEERYGQHIGNYRLGRVLGRGIFAQVYLGEHLYLKRIVAVKVLKDLLEEEQIERFCSEASLISQLDHPRIVRVLDFGVEQRVPYLVMEHAPNGTLRQRHPPGTTLPLPIVASYVQEIAAALDYAHQQKIIHRDVKPENLLLGAQQEVLLSDFGIAVVAHRTKSMTTQDGEGDPTYMAPEQLLRRARPASDQYALGVVVYEWLTGAPPFQGLPIEIGMQHLHAPPPLLSRHGELLAPEVSQVVLRALEKDYRQRFASVQAFADALSRVSQRVPTRSAAPETAREPLRATQVADHSFKGWARRRFKRA
ncbi:MAG TPA: serine/threonine-protein kinase [Ktedonobacterales bacterium]|nr:serine/threonine-protein kinase [Ktedonobacterales bacterium]